MIVLDIYEPKELLSLLQQYDVPIEQEKLEFGDIMFEGNGPDSRLFIGMERKHISDLITSMTSRRINGHQLKGMLTTYDHSYVIVEGMWRPGANGEIETFGYSGWRTLFSHGRGITYRQVDSFLDSLSVDGGITVVRTGTIKETAELIICRYKHWQKPHKQRNTFDLIYNRDLRSQRIGKVGNLTRRPNRVAKTAATFPMLDQKAWAVGDHFPNVFAMVTASLQEWKRVGNGIGPITAVEVYNYIRGKGCKVDVEPPE